MDVVNQVKLKLDKYEKCHMICDSDCPLGQLYDYTCMFQSFLFEKMKAAQDSQKSNEQAHPISNKE